MSSYEILVLVMTRIRARNAARIILKRCVQERNTRCTVGRLAYQNVSEIYAPGAGKKGTAVNTVWLPPYGYPRMVTMPRIRMEHLVHCALMEWQVLQ